MCVRSVRERILGGDQSLLPMRPSYRFQSPLGSILCVAGPQLYGTRRITVIFELRFDLQICLPKPID